MDREQVAGSGSDNGERGVALAQAGSGENSITEIAMGCVKRDLLHDKKSQRHETSERWKH